MVKSLVTFFCFFASMYTAAFTASIDVDISENENAWIGIDLAPGDELIVKVKGFQPPNGVGQAEHQVVVSGKEILNGSERYRLKMNDFVFLLDESQTKYCEETVLASSEDSPNNKVLSTELIKDCVQFSYIVKNRANTFNVVSVVRTDVAGYPLKFSRPLINKRDGWTLEFSGGFVVSWLTNPKYFASEETIGEGDDLETIQVIKRNSEGEDDQSLGMAAMVHTCWNYSSPSWIGWLVPDCGSFGLGISDQTGDLSFFPGITWRLGKEFFLTLGGQLAKVNTLPRGLAVGDTIDSANDLATLDTKYDTAFAITISYSFLGSKSRERFTSTFAPEPTSE